MHLVSHLIKSSVNRKEKKNYVGKTRRVLSTSTFSRLTIPMSWSGFDPLSSSLTEPQPLDTQTSNPPSIVDEPYIAFEPDIIKGKGGERLWIVAPTEDSATFCKMQLKVEFVVNVTDFRIKNSNSPSRPRNITRLLGQNSQKLSIIRRGLRIVSANIANALFNTPILIVIKAPIYLTVIWRRASNISKFNVRNEERSAIISLSTLWRRQQLSQRVAS
jgi:hypothetical protein